MVDEDSAEAVPTVLGGDAEMIEIAAAAVVTGEDGGGEIRTAANDRAEAGVAGENAGKLVARFVGADPFAGIPESEGVVVVGDGHGKELEFWGHQSLQAGGLIYEIWRAG